MTRGFTAKCLRVSIFALVLLCSVAALRATAADNWLIGTWATAAGLTYTFTADDVTLTGPSGKIGPLKVTSYDIADKTITVTADGLPGKAIATMVDATHASLDPGDGTAVSLTKQ
jgi:hypothetical protein